MTGPLWLIIAATLACVGLHFSPRGGVREIIFAVATLACVLTIPAGYLVGAW
ncbi:hypothetical protein I5G58_gp005 [Mycobacterium phage BirdsNest]|uniref:Uncharacterized protein n=1 Tax=Mycobacterium phage BirdsNest TaxID=2686231 RepID=A0A6B9L6L2_9CAUD|nr:hypothetical protein I5G58_gp005 [Mycobacterium phage BirdsNest]QHB37307.1 hypothetical protein PBI_BIRDSNEST_5 [Mycobacterium phage BirdsNest]